MDKKLLPSLSIFFPAYNDAQSIGPLTDACRKVASELTDNYEIIIINDCSQDNTGAVADALAARFPEVRVIHHPKNLGVGQTMIDGFTQAKKEYVFYTDGDAQYDVNEIKLLAAHAAEYDVLIGYRIRRAEGMKRLFISKCFHFLNFLMFGMWYRDIDCSFKMLRRRFLDRIRFQSKSALVDSEILLQARRLRVPVKEIGVHHYNRQFGSSQCLRIKLIFSMLADLVRLRFIYH